MIDLPLLAAQPLLGDAEAAAYHLSLALGRRVSERLAATHRLLTKVLGAQPEAARKVPSTHFNQQALETIDDELDCLLG